MNYQAEIERVLGGLPARIPVAQRERLTTVLADLSEDDASVVLGLAIHQGASLVPAPLEGGGVVGSRPRSDTERRMADILRYALNLYGANVVADDIEVHFGFDDDVAPSEEQMEQTTEQIRHRAYQLAEQLYTTGNLDGVRPEDHDLICRALNYTQLDNNDPDEDQVVPEQELEQALRFFGCLDGTVQVLPTWLPPTQSHSRYSGIEDEKEAVRADRLQTIAQLIHDLRFDRAVLCVTRYAIDVLERMHALADLLGQEARAVRSSAGRAADAAQQLHRLARLFREDPPRASSDVQANAHNLELHNAAHEVLARIELANPLLQREPLPPPGDVLTHSLLSDLRLMLGFLGWIGEVFASWIDDPLNTPDERESDQLTTRTFHMLTIDQRVRAMRASQRQHATPAPYAAALDFVTQCKMQFPIFRGETMWEEDSEDEEPSR